MKRMLAFFFFLLWPAIVSAQTRVSANVDYSVTSYGIDQYEANFKWYRFSGEVEHEFKKDKLWLISGFSAGVSKEGESLYDGTYLTSSLFHAFNMERMSVIVSGGVLYGMVGLQFDRTRLRYNDGKVIGYHNVSMQRNIAVPGMEIEKAGVLQPVIEIKARKYMKKLFIEGRSGIRLARFSAVDSDYHDSTYRESTVPMPSVGIGVGFTF